jgi:hypothetical protein
LISILVVGRVAQATKLTKNRDFDVPGSLRNFSKSITFEGGRKSQIFVSNSEQFLAFGGHCKQFKTNKSAEQIFKDIFRKLEPI